MLTDSGATSLIIDPNPMFVERAIGLMDKVAALKQVLTIGPVPPELAATADAAGIAAVDLTAKAATYEPGPLVAAASFAVGFLMAAAMVLPPFRPLATM